MSVLHWLEEYFVRDGIRYDFFSHPEAYSAQRTAQASHVSGSEEAKVVILQVSGRDWMFVLPATHHIDLEKLKKLLEVDDILFEDERELTVLFPDCQTGAMPPYGHLYGLPTVVDRSLAANSSIVFNAGSHAEAIRIKFSDYLKTANPLIGDFSSRGG